ncbi:hypothetical protein PMAYCL1PPCAC_00590, partial [Pristionchus mayeri]
QIANRAKSEAETSAEEEAVKWEGKVELANRLKDEAQARAMRNASKLGSKQREVDIITRKANELEKSVTFLTNQLEGQRKKANEDGIQWAI